DNDPKHSYKSSCKGLLQRKFSVVLEWPSNSPDLSPIENLWSIIKNKVEKWMPRNLENFMAEE
ncbi:hypothetical protein RhiirA5_302220, partial [Rhizophagus irregularis]